MLLNEFFGKSIKLKQGASSQDDKSEMNNDLFWFIIDHDKLHKDYFMPLAKKIKESNNEDKERLTSAFMPMVEKACKEYYQKKKMTGKLGKVFPKELREEMCERLYDHYSNDVLQDKYNLG